MEEQTFLAGFNKYCTTLHKMKRGGCCGIKKDKSSIYVLNNSNDIFYLNQSRYFWYEKWLLKE